MRRGTSFNEKDGFSPAKVHPLPKHSSGNSSGVFIEHETYDISIFAPPIQEDNIFIFLEKDGYMPLGVLPLTNNYPLNTEQVITDAILTNNGEYISVGDNFYLKYL